jgi:capsular exopolysaccharide synthesis family protein
MMSDHPRLGNACTSDCWTFVRHQENGQMRGSDYTRTRLIPEHLQAPATAGGDRAMGSYLRAVRARKWIVLLVLLAAVGASAAWLALRSPTYEATAQLLVTPLPQDDQTFLGFRLLRDSGDPTRTVQTAATLVESRSAAQAAAQSLGPDWDADAVLEAIEVEPEGESNILAVTATADSADEAARVANRFTRAALDERQTDLDSQIETELADAEARLSGQPTPPAELTERVEQLQALQGGEDPTLSLSQLATPPSSPSGAPVPLVLILAALGGLALGCVAAVLLELADRRLRDEADALAIYPVPILARVPRLTGRELRGGGLHPMHLPPAVREAFRTVVAQLDRGRSGARAVMITSGSTGDGKTTSAINLAVSMASAGHTVILLDFDVRKPDVANALGVDSQESMFTLMSEDVGLASLLTPVDGVPSLSVLATGGGEFSGDIAVELLTRRLPELLDEARSLADFIVIDTPPLGEVSDALRVADIADDVLLVIRPGHTGRTNLAVVRDLLERSGDSPRGMIVLGAENTVMSSYYEYGRALRQQAADGHRLSPAARTRRGSS